MQWDKVIEKQIRTYIQLIPDQKTQSGLECKIKKCPLASIRGDPTGLVLYHFDVKQCGEPCTRPELRIAPLRDAHYHRLVRAALNARTAPGQAASLKAGEVAIVLDGGRKGNTSKLLAPWKEGPSGTLPRREMLMTTRRRRLRRMTRMRTRGRVLSLPYGASVAMHVAVHTVI